MTVGTMDRRQILKALWTSGAALAISRMLPVQAASCPAWLTEENLIAEVRILGAAYIAAHPADSGIADVWSILAADDEESRARLRRMIQQDFKREQVVALRGWWVSRTEARLMAAVATSC